MGVSLILVGWECEGKFEVNLREAKILKLMLGEIYGFRANDIY